MVVAEGNLPDTSIFSGGLNTHPPAKDARFSK